MSQYQSFPGADGASRTFDKLLALKLPSLEGKRFLDVGCNEGFFCGYALSDGAVRAVGVDKSALFVARARERFPGAEFHQQGWEILPEGPFDVILLASALHYAQDQEELIRRLVDGLSEDGVLVLELGIAPSAVSEWVKVQRSADECYFPSMVKLREVLAGYAWKWMGPSISQDGDPIARHVVHIQRRRPVAYLLMQPPGYGKTSLATSLFAGDRIPVVSGDQQIELIAKEEASVSAPFRDAVKRDYSPFTIDRTIAGIFQAGHGGELVALWLSQVHGDDFALDMYVPAEHQAEVRRALLDAGYLPVQLEWEPAGPRLLSAAELGRRAEMFYLSLVAPGETPPATAPGEADTGEAVVEGFIDELAISGNRVNARGWAVLPGGRAVDALCLELGGHTVRVDQFERQLRPDVQQALGLRHSLFGFAFSVDVHGADEWGAGLRILPEGSRSALPLSASASRSLGAAS